MSGRGAGVGRFGTGDSGGDGRVGAHGGVPWSGSTGGRAHSRAPRPRVAATPCASVRDRRVLHCDGEGRARSGSGCGGGGGALSEGERGGKARKPAWMIEPATADGLLAELGVADLPFARQYAAVQAFARRPEARGMPGGV